MSIYFVMALSFLNGTALFATRITLSLYALKLGAHPATIGMLAGTFSLCPTLLAVTTGKLADRFGSRWLLMVGAVGGGMGMLIPYFVPGLPAVFIAGTMSGFSQVLFNLSTQNLVGLLSTPEKRAVNFSNYSLTNSASNLFGPLIAGFSIDHSDHVTSCLHLAMFMLIPVGMLAFKGADIKSVAPKISKVASRSGGGVREMLADPNVRNTLITGSLLNAGINLYQIYMPVYGHFVGLSASVIGIVLAMNSAAAFVVRLVLARLLKRYKEDQLLAYAFYTGAFSLTLVPLFHVPFMLGLLSFIFGLSMGCGQPIITMLMFSNSAEGRSGEGLGLKITVNQLTKLISPMMFGAIASAFGLWPMFWLNAMLLTTGGAFSRARGRAGAAADTDKPIK